jgi:hypothetical protein
MKTSVRTVSLWGEIWTLNLQYMKCGATLTGTFNLYTHVQTGSSYMISNRLFMTKFSHKTDIFAKFILFIFHCDIDEMLDTMPLR